MRWFALLLLLAGAVVAQQSSPGGFYVVCNPTDADNFSGGLTACEYAMTKPITNGMRLNIPWGQLETSSGVYNWTGTMGSGNQSVDTYIANAVAANMNIELAVLAGTQSPSWAEGAIITCGTDLVSFPVPWDTTFLSNYTTMIAALKTHLATVAKPGGGTVNAVPYVKIVEQAGINYQTAEFHLPTGTGTCTGGSVSIDQTWRSAGFTPAMVQAAYTTILTTIQAQFGTGVYVSTDMITPNGFSPIDNNGQIYVSPPVRSDELTRQILQSFLTNASYSSYKFAVQWNALSNIAPAIQPSVSLGVAASHYGNDILGYQNNEKGGLSGGSWCNYGGTFRACDGTITGTANGDFELIITTGCGLGAKYLEFWGANVDQLTAVVADLKSKSMCVPS